MELFSSLNTNLYKKSVAHYQTIYTHLLLYGSVQALVVIHYFFSEGLQISTLLV